MTAESLPMLPWYPRDWIAATRLMSLAERGAYMDLLSYQWEMGGLPNSHAKLMRLLGVSEAEFAEVWPGIKTKFREIRGLLYNDRLEEHREKALKSKDDKVSAGKLGANARWHGKGNGSAMAAPLAEGMTKTCPPSPSPSPSPTPPPAEELHTEGAANFPAIKAAYPKFSGRQDWLNAQHFACLLVDRGCTWQQLLDGVLRYAAYCKGGGVSSDRYVMSPGKFFSDANEPWTQPWNPPAVSLVKKTRFDQIMEARRGGQETE